jgi:hypothetical protein
MWQCVVLTRVWRQADPEFVGRLNAIRFGDNAAAAELAERCARPLPETAGIKPTQASVGSSTVGASCISSGSGSYACLLA